MRVWIMFQHSYVATSRAPNVERPSLAHTRLLFTAFRRAWGDTVPCAARRRPGRLWDRLQYGDLRQRQARTPLC